MYSLLASLSLLNIRLITAILFISFNTYAAESILVVTEYLAPYQIKNEDNSLGGVSTDVVKALFKETNDEFDIKLMPWARAYKTALTKKDTLIYSILRTPAREKLFHWIGAIKSERIYIWALKSSHFDKINTIDQLNTKRIGLVRNSYAEKFIQNKKFTKIDLLVNDDQNIRMLFKHRIDLIIGDALTLAPRAKKYNLDFSQIEPLFEVKPLSVNLYIAFNLNSDPKLVRRYQQAFKKLEKSGKIKAILKNIN